MYRDSAPGSIGEDLKGLRASGRETGKANHSDPYTRPPRGGCIRYCP